MSARLAIGLAAIALAGCNPSRESGYVEVRMQALFGAPPELYLDDVRIEGLRNGTAVIRKAAGAAKLQLFKADTYYPLCAFEVRKNRVVTLTVATVDRKFKCDVQT